MTKIIIGNVYSQIINLNNDKVFKQIDDVLSYFVAGHEFSSAFTKGFWSYKENRFCKWDGKSHLFLKNGRFLSGLLSRIISILNSNGIQYEIDDQRKQIQYGPEINLKNVQIRDYQQRVLESCLKNECGLVNAATGSGKTIMICDLISHTNVKTIVYVVSKDLLFQTHSELERILGQKVGIIGDGIANIEKINVASIWTCAIALGEKKYEKFDDEDIVNEKWNDTNKSKIIKMIKGAEMALFDESQFIATKTIILINNASVSARRKYGFSGTNFREDGADILLEAVCGKIIVEVTSSELIKQKFLVEPEIHFITVPKKEFKDDTYPKVYKEYIVENEERNNLIVKATAKLVEMGHNVLLLIKNLKHGRVLLELLENQYPTYFIKGETEAEDRIVIKKQFEEGTIKVLIASSILDQGVNLPSISALVLCGGGKSAGRTIQRIGRVLRPFPGKEKAIIIDFIDQAPHLLRHTKRRIEVYRRESGFRIILPKKPENKGIISSRKNKNGNNNDTETKTKKKKAKRVQPGSDGGKMPW